MTLLKCSIRSLEFLDGQTITFLKRRVCGIELHHFQAMAFLNGQVFIFYVSQCLAMALLLGQICRLDRFQRRVFLEVLIRRRFKCLFELFFLLKKSFSDLTFCEQGERYLDFE